ncbi:MAG: ABC transporter ATP-binding protein, partial [Gemmatimonadales bacterium]
METTLREPTMSSPPEDWAFRLRGRKPSKRVGEQEVMSDQPLLHEEEALGKAYDARLMRRLLQYLAPYWWLVGLAILILAAASATEIVGPWLTKVALDDAIPPPGDRHLLSLLAMGYLGAMAFGFVLQYAQRILTAWLGQRIMYDLRREIFHKLQRLDLRYYDRNPVGRLITRITSDVETLNELFASGIVTVFGDVFTLVFIVAVMVKMDWKLALAAFSVLPFVAWTAFVFRAKVREAYRDIRVRLARINSFLHERFTGIRVVQLFNREESDSREHHRVSSDYLEAHLRSITYYALFFPVIELFTAIALALILWSGGSSILEGAVTVGVVAAFLQYARRFFRPIQDLSEKYNLLQGAMASSERIFKLLDHPIDLVDPVSPIPLPTPTRGEIEFRDVWFAYGDTEEGEPDWVLKGVSFKVESGEKIAIVGHTGAGKTTLGNLLMRFYEPQKGTILLDGIPIHEASLQELRGRIGLVLQDVFLFSQDVAYNIRLGSDEISDPQIQKAALRVGADRIVRGLPKGYAQPLGERGSSLSVGERQLLSFARALAFDPSILILDEA